jgi:hypothetical protein
MVVQVEVEVARTILALLVELVEMVETPLLVLMVLAAMLLLAVMVLDMVLVVVEAEWAVTKMVQEPLVKVELVEMVPMVSALLNGLPKWL